MDKSHGSVARIPPWLWTCISLPPATHQNKHSLVLQEGIYGGEKAISGQTRGGEEGEKDLKESWRKAEGSDTERERCLIWHGVPPRHLISFNSCGGESRVAEDVRGWLTQVGGEPQISQQMATSVWAPLTGCFLTFTFNSIQN